jgi:uncharacterized phage protein (TIGR02218 family)
VSALAEHAATGATTMCRAWLLSRRDGARFGFTDHDGPLVVEGVTCRAATGLTAGALQSATGLSVDNVEAAGALSDEAITAADLRAGLWDAAEVSVWLVNWADPAQRQCLFAGRLGEIGWGEGAFRADLRGVSEALNRVRGRVYQARCDAVLGDGRCRARVRDARFSAEVPLEAVSGESLLVPAIERFAGGWLVRGTVEVLDGPSKGAVATIRKDVRQGARRRLVLWESLAMRPEPGTRLRVTAGCAKTAKACRVKWDNFANFRGFPHVPGEDWLLAHPAGHDVNDGGRR